MFEISSDKFSLATGMCVHSHILLRFVTLIMILLVEAGHTTKWLAQFLLVILSLQFLVNNRDEYSKSSIKKVILPTHY